MSANTSVLRGPKTVHAKTRTLARTNTTGKALCTLPKGARLIGILVTGTASDAATSATLSFGNTVTANEYGTCDVKTPAALASITGTGAVLTADTPIYGVYAETGAASSVGGTWYCTVLYTTGNLLNDDATA